MYVTDNTVLSAIYIEPPTDMRSVPQNYTIHCITIGQRPDRITVEVFLEKYDENETNGTEATTCKDTTRVFQIQFYWTPLQTHMITLQRCLGVQTKWRQLQSSVIMDLLAIHFFYTKFYRHTSPMNKTI